ncbi:MAG TPA: N-acetylmuramoyl-L-alanine amidase [Acidimicrobiales bacterium]|nr:N-acetylmuramoyl-L-alanine amidase [Acidimicrobiales bacterium]
MPRQLWLADRLRQAGLTVVEVDGWQSRGAESFNPRGVVCHHTAGSANGDMPSLGLLVRGRSDCPGPLCNVGLARSGAVYVVASGRANHAGKGAWRDLTGNSSVLGIEAENTGRGEAWPQVQLDAYVRLAAALQGAVGGNVDNICAHREWTSRKIDPAGIDMNDFRARAAQILGGANPPPPPPPSPPTTDQKGRIAELQQLVGAGADGAWGSNTDAACSRNMIGWPDFVRGHAPTLADKLTGNTNRELVRWLQRQGNRKLSLNLTEDGLLGPATNHFIVVGLGQGDGVCGPKGFKAAVA